MNELQLEILEIIREIKRHLIYQRELGAFVYGMDTIEETLDSQERIEKLERVSKAKMIQNDAKFTPAAMSLFERVEKGVETVKEDRKVFSGKNKEEKQKLISELKKEIGEDCKRCNLGNLGRQKVVFGEGNIDCRIMFVGEGPGEDEDIEGLPFVGRAGQLLTKIIKAMGLERTDVYIANVVKCRPPGNRTPLPDEMDICGKFLKRQISIINPEVIIALGGTAVSFLLGDYKIRISQVKGRRLEYMEGDILIPMVATFHPSYVLRRGESPDVKKEVWNDIKIALDIIGMEVRR